MFLLYALFTLLLACISEATRAQVGDILARHNVDASDMKGLKMMGDNTVLRSRNGDITTITDHSLAQELDDYNLKATPTLKPSRLFPGSKTGLLNPRFQGGSDCPKLCGGGAGDCSGTSNTGVNCSGACFKACGPEGEECFSYCSY